MAKEIKEASYVLTIEDVLIQAKHRERVIDSIHHGAVMGWMIHYMPDFFSFAKDELINAVINEFTKGEEE